MSCERCEILEERLRRAIQVAIKGQNERLTSLMNQALATEIASDEAYGTIDEMKAYLEDLPEAVGR